MPNEYVFLMLAIFFGGVVFGICLLLVLLVLTGRG